MKEILEILWALALPLAIVLGYLAYKYNWPIIRDL
jgi:hypothetical protein